MATDKEQIERIQRILDLSEDEAIALIQSDKAIDKMKTSETDNDLTDSQKQVSKKYRDIGTKAPKVYKLDATKKPRKENAPKRELITLLQDILSAKGASAIDTLNPEREFEFLYKGVKYKIILSAPRK